MARDGELTDNERWINLIGDIASCISIKRPKEVIFHLGYYIIMLYIYVCVCVFVSTFIFSMTNEKFCERWKMKYENKDTRYRE